MTRPTLGSVALTALGDAVLATEIDARGTTRSVSHENACDC